jgi:hypothetical protein
METLFVIKQPVQFNGLFGIPISCTNMVDAPTKENEFIHSAIVTALAENHPDDTFRVFNIKEEGFWIHFELFGLRIIEYKKFFYDMTTNTLHFSHTKKRK